MTPSPRPDAPLRTDAVLLAASAAVCAAAWAMVLGRPEAAAWFLLPGPLAGAFALPVALSVLRGRRGVALAAFAAAAALAPLLSYWDRFPFQLGVIPTLGHIEASDVLAGLPSAVFGLLLLRRPRPTGGLPGPAVLADAAQAVLAACLVGVLASAVSRGGQFGLSYLLASLALMAGLFKGALLQGAVAAVAALVIARDGRGRGRLAAATAFALLAGGAALAVGTGSLMAWAAGFGLTLLARLSRGWRRGRREAAIPAPAAA